MVRPSNPDPSNLLSEILRDRDFSNDQTILMQSYSLTALWNSIVLTHSLPSTLLVDDPNCFTPKSSSSPHKASAVISLASPLGLKLLTKFSKSPIIERVSKFATKELGSVDEFSSTILAIDYAFAHSIGTKIIDHFDDLFLNKYSFKRMSPAKKMYVAPVEMVISNLIHNPKWDNLGGIFGLLSILEHVGSLWAVDTLELIKSSLPDRSRTGKIEVSYKISIQFKFVKIKKDLYSFIRVYPRYSIYSESPYNGVWSVLGDHIYVFPTERGEKKHINVGDSDEEKSFGLWAGLLGIKEKSKQINITIEDVVEESYGEKRNFNKTVIASWDEKEKRIRLLPMTSFFPSPKGSDLPSVFWDNVPRV